MIQFYSNLFINKFYFLDFVKGFLFVFADFFKMRRAYVKRRDYTRPNRGTAERILAMRASARALSRRAPARRAVVAAVRNASEKKGVDTSIALTPVIATTNTNASSFVLNLIQAGNGSWNRVGRKVHLKSLRLRGHLRWLYGNNAGTNNLDANAVRMVVVWDKQPSGGAIPTFDAIFGKTD